MRGNDYSNPGRARTGGVIGSSPSWGAIRDVGPRKCQSRMALRGAALTHSYKLSRRRRNLQGGGASRGAIRERGQHERARSRVALGQQQFSRGADSNDKDLLWLLAPT